MIIVQFLVSAIRFGMTLLFGSTGEIITEKSGHLNLGIPGVMCVGASFGCFAVSKYYDALAKSTAPGELVQMNGFVAVLLAIVATVIGGMLMGLIFSFFTVTLRANQNVTGLVLTTLGVGISKFVMTGLSPASYGVAGKFFGASLPFASKLGAFGKLFFSYGVLVYLAIVIAIVASLVLNKTRLGLHLRAVGENPATADAAGINVDAYRYGATSVGCGISALGGLTYIMDYLNGNWEYVIDSIGWLCVALVIFSIWRPIFGILCAIVFSGTYVVASYLELSLAAQEAFRMLPYIVTIVVLIITSVINKKENQPPAALGLPYFREER